RSLTRWGAPGRAARAGCPTRSVVPQEAQTHRAALEELERGEPKGEVDGAGEPQRAPVGRREGGQGRARGHHAPDHVDALGGGGGKSLHAAGPRAKEPAPPSHSAPQSAAVKADRDTPSAITRLTMSMPLAVGASSRSGTVASGT